MIKLLPNTVINFHDVNDKDWIKRALLIIKKNFDIIPIQTLEEYYYTKKYLKNSCHITFDDGDISFYNVVYPILKEHRIPVSIFVSPLAAKERKNFWFQEIKNFDKEKILGIIKKNNFLEFDFPVRDRALYAIIKSLPIEKIWKIIDDYRLETGALPVSCINMDPDHLIELHNSGLVNIGAHTLNHPILKNESYRDSKFEISKSIEQLSDMLGTNVKTFAFPNGNPFLDFGSRELKFLTSSNISLSFSTQNKSFDKRDNPLSIPRKGINKGEKLFIISKMILGSKWDLFKKLLRGKQEDDYRMTQFRKSQSFQK